MTVRRLSILAFVLLAGCTSLTDLKRDVSERMFGPEPTDPPMALAEFKAKATAKLLWSASVGKAEGYSYTPAVDGNAIFAASTKGEITRLDAATGKQVWRVSAGETISGGVGAGENLVLVGTPKGMVLVEAMASGRPVVAVTVASGTGAPGGSTRGRANSIIGIAAF